MMRALFLGSLLALAACGDRAPEGQVVATVNGDEITRPQLNAALAASGDTGGRDADETGKAAVRNAVLDRLVARQLIVQEAKRQGIDRSQDYLLAIHAAEDRILGDMLAARVVRGLRAPYARDVAQYIRDNPSRFAARTILGVDQIRYSSGVFAASGLNDAHDMAEIARRLTAARAPFERSRAAIDSATLSPELYRSLEALPAGEPFVIVQNDRTLVSVITERRPASIAPEAADRLAQELIRQDAGRVALEKQLQTLRRSATIAYQPGFAAPKATVKPASPPAS